MKRLLIGAAVVLALGGVVFASLKMGNRKQGVRVYVEEAATRDIARIVKASGTIDPRVKVNISAHVIARVEKVHVKEGQWVEVGAPFLELERDAFVAIRDRVAAERAIADSRLRQSRINPKARFRWCPPDRPNAGTDTPPGGKIRLIG